MRKVTISSNARRRMLAVNIRQKDFYESRFEANETNSEANERAANAITNLWSRMRLKMISMRRALGIEDRILALHQRWLGDLTGMRVLDLGCFTGNLLSLWIAERCAEYVGIDLSQQAITVLNAQLRERGLTHAHAYADDFLANTFPDDSFDIVYANAVLHHFRNLPVMLQELQRILKPGGIVVSLDPLSTEPLNHVARLLFRPFQSDRAWEWPFKRSTFRQLARYFAITDIQGYVGMSKLGLLFLLVPGGAKLGQVIGQWGMRYDFRRANRLGTALYLCWGVTLRLQKPQQWQVQQPVAFPDTDAAEAR